MGSSRSGCRGTGGLDSFKNETKEAVNLRGQQPGGTSLTLTGTSGEKISAVGFTSLQALCWDTHRGLNRWMTWWLVETQWGLYQLQPAVVLVKSTTLKSFPERDRERERNISIVRSAHASSCCQPDRSWRWGLPTAMRSSGLHSYQTPS